MIAVPLHITAHAIERYQERVANLRAAEIVAALPARHRHTHSSINRHLGGRHAL